jgi:uncharacterized lipoprotein YmbA
MIRFARTSLLVAALLMVACGAMTTNRNYYLGTGADRCLASDSDCHLARECCSNWCVNGVCEYRQ